MLGDDLLHFIFDVESIGLQGEGFAVGWVTLDRRGIEIASGLLVCDSELAEGTSADREWVKNNVPTMAYNHISPWGLRLVFTRLFHRLNTKKLMVYANCPWPVEANFLTRCVFEHSLIPPYPLYDICSLMLAKGFDPLLPYGRLEIELPEHNPLNDARQSARILRELYLA